MKAMVYNDRISRRANENIRRRQAVVRKEKRIITISIILLISVIAILCSSIKAMASSNNESEHYEKMYKSVTVESGDTLWNIADKYNVCSDMSKEQYINEIKSINHLGNGQLTSGQSIVIAYFERE